MDFKEVHKLTAIVFTDLVGFTDIMEHSEQDGLELLKKQREILFPIVESHRGEILKEMGDGLLIMFDSSIRAVRCAIEIQKTAQDNDISLRIGIHIGDIVVKKKDIIGSGVNIASRIEPLAPAGGICISEDVWRQIRNQKDLFAESIGKRELKGVNHPIEIYELTDSELASRKATIPTIKDVWQRRVPQILALYLGACWAIIEFVTWLTQQYLLSPHLINLSFITLLSFIPTTILLAYFHGKPGKDEWTKVEKIGIPFNVLFSIFLLVFLFNGKELGSITQTVTAENEEGQTIERVIPKSEFRKNIGIFFFENASQDSTLDWMQYALSYMIAYDLSQDMFLNVKNGYDFLTVFSDYKDDYINNTPLSMQRKIAKQNLTEYFISGSIDIRNDKLFISSKLYKTENANLLKEFSFEATNLFKTVDEITSCVKNELELSIGYTKESIDLPISEILTNNIIALELFIKGINNRYFNNTNYSKYYKEAVKMDSTFIEAYIAYIEFNKALLEGLEFTVGYSKKMRIVIRDTSSSIFKQRKNNSYTKMHNNFFRLLNYLYRLPENQQYYVKALYYNFLKEADKERKTIDMWKVLYPNDISPYYYCAKQYIQNDSINKAISEYNSILTLDASQLNCLVSIGDLYLEQSDFQLAFKYYKLYSKNIPNSILANSKLAGVYIQMDNLEQVKKIYEKINIIDPGKKEFYIALGQIDTYLNHFDEALKIFNVFLEENKTIQVFNHYIAEIYLLKGQIIDYIKYKEKAWMPGTYTALKIKTYRHYLLLNMPIDVERKINALKQSQYEPSMLNPLFYNKLIYTDKLRMDIITQEELANVKESVAYYEINEYDKLSQFGINDDYYLIKALLLETDNNYKDAIDLLIQISSLHRNDPAVDAYHQSQMNFLRYDEVIKNLCLSRCYRKIKDFKRATEINDELVKYLPSCADIYYEYALLYQGMGKKKKAIEELNKALEIWKDADLEFIPAQMARDKLLELES